MGRRSTSSTMPIQTTKTIPDRRPLLPECPKTSLEVNRSLLRPEHRPLRNPGRADWVRTRRRRAAFQQILAVEIIVPTALRMGVSLGSHPEALCPLHPPPPLSSFLFDRSLPTMAARLRMLSEIRMEFSYHTIGKSSNINPNIQGPCRRRVT